MQQNRNSFNARKIALSGMLLALTVITLYFASFLPGKLSLYALSSFFVSIIIMEFSIKAGWVFYIASCLLSLILPDKMAIVPYVLFFGAYGIAKYYIERLRKIIIEYLLKLVYFNILVAAAILLAKQLQLIPDKLQDLPLIIIIAVLQVIFIIYDYVYTAFIQFYNVRLKKLLKIH